MLNPRNMPTIRRVSEWPVRSQQVSRRNALIACTALADRRRQRIEVEEFLESLSRRSEATTIVRTAARR